MKKLLVIALMAVVVMASSQAFAFDLGGYVGPVSLKFSGFSQSGDTTYIGGTGETWAIMKLTSIEDNLTNELWSQGDNGGEYIYGIIYGLYDANVTGTDPLAVNQLGGNFALYLYNDGNTANEFLLDNPLTRRAGGQSTYTSITDGGTLFLSGAFTPGIDSANNYTVQQIYSPTSKQGSGEGFADINGGAFAYLFTPGNILDNQGNFRDLNFDFDVSTQAAAPGWYAKIDDPVRATAVPEPTSMLLLGSGLLGLVGLKRRK